MYTINIEYLYIEKYYTLTAKTLEQVISEFLDERDASLTKDAEHQELWVEIDFYYVSRNGNVITMSNDGEMYTITKHASNFTDSEYNTINDVFGNGNTPVYS